MQRITAHTATGQATFLSDGFNPGVTLRTRYLLGQEFEAAATVGISRLGFNTTSGADTLTSSSTARWQAGLDLTKFFTPRFSIHAGGLLDKRAYAWRAAPTAVTIDLLTIAQVGGGVGYRVAEGSWGSVRAGVDMSYLVGGHTVNYAVSGGWLARAAVAYEGVADGVPGSIEAYVVRAHQSTSLYTGETAEMGLMLIANFDVLGG